MAAEQFAEILHSEAPDRSVQGRAESEHPRKPYPHLGPGEDPGDGPEILDAQPRAPGRRARTDVEPLDDIDWRSAPEKSRKLRVLVHQGAKPPPGLVRHEGQHLPLRRFHRLRRAAQPMDQRGTGDQLEIPERQEAHPELLVDYLALLGDPQKALHRAGR